MKEKADKMRKVELTKRQGKAIKESKLKASTLAHRLEGKSRIDETQP